MANQVQNNEKKLLNSVSGFLKELKEILSLRFQICLHTDLLY